MINIEYKFQISIHYEIFFALQALTDPEGRIHPEWKQRARAALSSTFHRRFEALGPSSFLWPCIADAIEEEENCKEFRQLIAQLEQLPIHDFQRRILIGAVHDPKLVESMIAGKSLFDAIRNVRKAKQEWLGFIGLYPYQKQRPMVRALESVLRAPQEFRKEVISLLKSFWNSSFEQTWSRLQPKFQRSLQEKERLFQSCSLKEFAQFSLLRVEINEEKGYLKAVRGGFQIPLRDLKQIYFLPSCFNDRRHWTCYDGIACFPYFDPAISIDTQTSVSRAMVAEPELDPALIFAALGDSTRFAIVSIVARSATSGAELGRLLGLTPATVSHHVHVLREAGLLQELAEGKSLCLSLNREVIEGLSQLAIEKLYESKSDISMKKTRTK